MLESLGIAPPQILINIVGFVVLFGLLSKFLYQPIQNVLEERRLRIHEDQEAAARHRVEMEQRQRELEERLSQIESEVRDRMQAAEKEAQQVRSQLLSEAAGERERIIESGLSELRREREKAMVEIRNLVAELAVTAAAKIIESELDLEAHRAMIDDIVEHGVQ